jgi:opacity protein-like surface antigen
MGMHKTFLAALVSACCALAVFTGAALAQDDRREPSQVCTIIINIIDNDQYINQGDISAGVIQYISQRLNIRPIVVQECIQNIEGDNDHNNKNDNDNNGGGSGGSGGSGAVGADVDSDLADVAGVEFHRGDAVLSDTIPEGVLPFTGGPPLGGFVLLAVALFVGARLFRR